MTTSKLALLTATIAAVCVPVGYSARRALEPASQPAPAGILPERVESGAKSEEAEPPLPESELVLEWKRLLAEYGQDPESMPQLHRALQGIDDPFRKRAFLSALIAEWAKVDPAGGMAFFREDDRPGWQRSLFLREWLKRDPRAAVDGLMASGDGWEGLARDHLLEIARRDPGSIPNLAARLPEPRSVWDTKIRDAFELIAGRDLAGSREAALALSGPNRVQALAGVAMAWAQKDGPASFEWAESMEGDDADRYDVMRGVLFGWARVDPHAALDRVGLIPAGGAGLYYASSTGAKVLREAGEADFEATVEWLGRNPGKLGHADLTGLSTAVQPRFVADPAGFLTEMTERGVLSSLMPSIDSVLLNDGANTRLEVWEWLQGAGENESTRRLRHSVLGGLAWQNPEAGIELVEGMSPGPGRDEMREMAANRIVNGGSNLAVLDDLLPEASPEWRTALLRSAFLHLRPDQFYDPELWISRLPEVEDEMRTTAVSNLATAWSEEDPEASIQWVGSLEDEAERVSAFGAISGRWARTDAYSTGEWIASMPAGPERDAAAHSLVGAIAESNPEEAWEWVASIGTQAPRIGAAEQVLRGMIKRDRERAMQWLVESGLPPEDKERLGEMLAERSNQDQP